MNEFQNNHSIVPFVLAGIFSRLCPSYSGELKRICCDDSNDKKQITRNPCKANLTGKAKEFILEFLELIIPSIQRGMQWRVRSERFSLIRELLRWKRVEGNIQLNWIGQSWSHLLPSLSCLRPAAPDLAEDKLCAW